MGAAKATAIALAAPPELDHDWSSLNDPSVVALLDHIGEELAREYVRLMEDVAAAEEVRDRRAAAGDQEV